MIVGEDEEEAGEGREEECGRKKAGGRGELNGGKGEDRKEDEGGAR